MLVERCTLVWLSSGLTDRPGPASRPGGLTTRAEGAIVAPMPSPTPPPPTLVHQLIDARLDQLERELRPTLAEELTADALVEQRRAEGISWRKIATEIYDLTGIDVTHETLRSWYPEAA